jgi:hypothetical protein
VFVDDVAHKGDGVASGLLKLGDDREIKGSIGPSHYPYVLELPSWCQVETQPLGLSALASSQRPCSDHAFTFSPGQAVEHRLPMLLQEAQM